MTAPEHEPHVDEWFGRLREQFLAVARHRVPSEDVEDVVQQALAVVHRRRDGLEDEFKIDGMPVVAWCFRVLRNTVGNYYKQRRRRGNVIDLHPDPAEAEEIPVNNWTPAESLEQEESTTIVLESLQAMKERDPKCHEYIREVMNGKKPRTVAHAEGLEESVFYRRLYRCREKLRTHLRAKGVLP